jgi:hypothetical protein
LVINKSSTFCKMVLQVGMRVWTRGESWNDTGPVERGVITRIPHKDHISIRWCDGEESIGYTTEEILRRFKINEADTAQWILDKYETHELS